MLVKRIFITTLTVFCLSTVSTAQQELVSTLPSVIMIGEQELAYEAMVSGCSEHLLSVCNDSMEGAYKEWLLMLKDMETFAEAQEFDIRGIKIWLNIFFNMDGTIKHLAFYPKPNSRNMDFEELRHFFAEFVKQYKFSKTNAECFAHYGSAKFPSFADMFIQNNGN